MCHSSTLQLRPQYLGLMRYRLPIQRGLEVASVSYNLSGGILDKKTKVEMVTLSRGYLPTFLTDYLMLTCSPYRWHTINMRSHYTDPSVHLAYHFCALSPLHSCSIFIYSCSCSACTLYTRLYHLIAAFRGETNPFFPQFLSCSSQCSLQVSMAFMLLPSV